MAEAVQVADHAEQMRALSRTGQAQRHGLFQVVVLEPPVHTTAVVECAHVARSPYAVAGDEHHVVGVERIDRDVAHPVRMMVARPRRIRVVERRAREHRGPVPAAIGAAVDLVVRRVVAERGGHQHLRIVRVHRDVAPTEAAGLAVARQRRDVDPAVVGRRVFPHRAIVHLIRPGLVAIGQVPVAVGTSAHVVGTQAGRLTGHRAPARAAVGGAEQAGLPGGHAGVQHRRRLTRRAAGRIEHHEHDADRLSSPVVFCACRRRGGDGRKAVDARPARRVVGAPPQAGGARTQEKNAAVMRIDREPFAVAAAQFVAAELERQIDPLERVAAVVRTQDRAVAGARGGVGAGGKIDPAGVMRIQRDAVDAAEVGLVGAQPVGQRHPVLRGIVPAVRATDIGARVVQAPLRRMKHQPADVTAPADAHAAERVGQLARSRRQRREQAAEQQADGQQAADAIGNGGGLGRAHHLVNGEETGNPRGNGLPAWIRSSAVP